MYGRRDWDINETCYPAIRLSMGESRLAYNDDQLEDYVDSLLPGANPEDVENFMRSLQRFGRQVAPLAQRALPGMIQGAAQGGMVAGPWGAVAGALGGGAASLLSGGGQSRVAPQPRPQQTPQQTIARSQTPVTPAQSAIPQTTVPTATRGGAQRLAPIQQLLALISRPETMQALATLLMSGSRRSMVNVGRQSVPAAAFANAIAEIAADVVDKADELGNQEVISEYLLDSEGQFRGDVVNPAERARLLVDEILAIASQEDSDDYDDEDDEEDIDEIELQVDDEEVYDDHTLDSYELAVEGGMY